MNSQSVPAAIFNTLLIFMIKETISDELGDYDHLLMKDYNLLINNLQYPLLK